MSRYATEDLKPRLRPNAAGWKSAGHPMQLWVDNLVAQFSKLAREDVSAGIPPDDAVARSRTALEDVATVVTETWGVRCRVVDHGTVGDFSALSIAIENEGTAAK